MDIWLVAAEETDSILEPNFMQKQLSYIYEYLHKLTI